MSTMSTKGASVARRITQQLRQEGVVCGENRVARLMRENELAARRKKAFRPRTTLPGQGAALNLIKELEPGVPNQVWVSDITYVAPLEGWLYLAGSVRPDADCLDRLKALDDRGKILLNGRLWPFPQPSKRGSRLIAGNTDECVQLLPNGVIHTCG